MLTRVPFGAGSFGWTAYSPLSGESYRPVDLNWLIWAPRIGLLLLALGAGAAGASITALVLTGRPRRRASD